MLRRMALPKVRLSLVQGAATAGGGSLPGQSIPSVLVSLQVDGLSAPGLEARLRELPVPIISRIEDDRIFLDARTIQDDELPMIRDGLHQIIENNFDRI